jgi:uncharacterized protein (TIGR00251 family)
MPDTGELNSGCCCQIAGGSIQLAVKALPGASKMEFAGICEGRLRVRIAAAPESGRANAALVSFIASAVGCTKRDIKLLRGEKSRLKTLALPLACKVELEKIIGPMGKTEK